MSDSEDDSAKFIMRRPMLRNKWIRVYLKGNRTIYIRYASSKESANWPALTTASIYNEAYWKGIDNFPNSDREKTNALLVNVRENTYMYVGQEIYTFEVNDFISEFISEEGSAHTPFSIGLGKDYVYFFTEKMKVDRSVFQEFARTAMSTPLNKAGYRRFDNLVGKRGTVIYRMLYEMCRSDPEKVTTIKILSTML